MTQPPNSDLPKERLQPGDTFTDRYVVSAFLGEGGMGSVYVVEDQLLSGMKVALKILHPEMAANSIFAKRFLQEVEVTRHVGHPNVVRTFDVGVFRGLPYFSMELVEGCALHELRREYFFDEESVIQIILQICQGLHAIHTQNIIHRDLKPDNILVSKAGQIKIADFGIAKRSSSHLTEAGAIIGSPGYLAPEVWQQKHAVVASDLYSLGIILYECVTGKILYDTDNIASVMWQHITQTPPPLSKVEPDTLPWLENLISKLLKKDPSQRFQSAMEIIAHLSNPTIREKSEPSEKKEEQKKPESKTESELGSPSKLSAQELAKQEEYYAEKARERREEALRNLEEEEIAEQKRFQKLLMQGLIGITLVSLCFFISYKLFKMSGEREKQGKIAKQIFKVPQVSIPKFPSFSSLQTKTAPSHVAASRPQEPATTYQSQVPSSSASSNPISNSWHITVASPPPLIPTALPQAGTSARTQQLSQSQNSAALQPRVSSSNGATLQTYSKIAGGSGAALQPQPSSAEVKPVDWGSDTSFQGGTNVEPGFPSIQVQPPPTVRMLQDEYAGLEALIGEILPVDQFKIDNTLEGMKGDRVELLKKWKKIDSQISEITNVIERINGPFKSPYPKEQLETQYHITERKIAELNSNLTTLGTLIEKARTTGKEEEFEKLVAISPRLQTLAETGSLSDEKFQKSIISVAESVGRDILTSLALYSQGAEKIRAAYIKSLARNPRSDWKPADSSLEKLNIKQLEEKRESLLSEKEELQKKLTKDEIALSPILVPVEE